MRASPLATATTAAEPTLSVTLSRQVHAALPGQLALLLQLAIPVAVDFARIGWWRSAGWALAISAFGSWGLTDHWLARSADAKDWQKGLLRAARVAAGVIASALPCMFLLEMFLRLLGNAPTF